MNHRNRLISLLLILLISINSCNKEIELLDNYKDIPIVYGLIDANDSISYIRIQKAFLSDDNIYEDAQISDSNLFSYKLDVSIKSGDRIIKFDTITLNNKEEGTFFSPNIPIYYANTKNLLNVNLPIELEIRNPKTGDIANSTANLMDASDIWIIRPVFDVSLLENFRIEYKTLANIRIYQLVVRFHYMEMQANDSSTQVYKYTDMISQLEKSETAYGGEIIRFQFNKDYFFENLINTISPTNDLERYIGKIELIVKTTEESFFAYYESAQPNNSVIEHNLIYSNIENAYGIFAGKSSKNRILRIDNQSKTLIRNLDGLNFISSIPEED